MDRVTTAFRRAVEVGFTLSPLAVSVYLWAFQSPPLLLRHHMLHEVAIVTATALGTFVAIITLHCYRATGEFFARHLFLGLAGFTFLYAFHGLLTRADGHNLWLFILFGPAARTVLALYICIGVFGYDRPRRPEAEHFARAWMPHGLALVAVVPVIVLLAESPIAGHFATRATMEFVTIALCLAAIGRLLVRQSPFGMKRYLLVGLALTVQGSITFLMTAAWTHLWWFAHLLGAAGFMVLAYGVVRATGSSRSFSHLFSETEMVARLAKAEEVEKVLRRAKEEAEAASRSKSEFLAAMSHELRTPLNAVIGFSQMMRAEVHGPMLNDRYREYAQLVEDSGSHLLDLINDVLDVSRIEVGGLTLDDEVVRLPDIMKSAAVMVRGRAERSGIDLTITDVPDDFPLLRADPRRVKQVMLNLLGNAVKFTESGGHITIAARQESNGDVAVSVSDTGIGMTPEDIPKALALFGQVDSRLERRYEGSGLGLPLTRSMMELHGGTLTIESQRGQGTTVIARFPADRVVAASAPCPT